MKLHGFEIEGSFAFGDSPALQDELLAFVARGSKRATAGSVAELERASDPWPEPGQYWGLLDGRGEGRFVMQTVEVTRGRLVDVTPAFAWDEGEHDRTRESWLEGHRRYFTRQGVGAADDLELVFERFRIVWPQPDTTVWLTPDVRELRWDERAGLGTDLPGLVHEVDGAVRGTLTFRPRPGGVVEVAAVDGDEAPLRTGLAALARREGWPAAP
jgi:uncharacterized protein YhfF